MAISSEAIRPPQIAIASERPFDSSWLPLLEDQIHPAEFSVLSPDLLLPLLEALPVSKHLLVLLASLFSRLLLQVVLSELFGLFFLPIAVVGPTCGPQADQNDKHQSGH